MDVVSPDANSFLGDVFAMASLRKRNDVDWFRSAIALDTLAVYNRVGLGRVDLELF